MNKVGLVLSFLLLLTIDCYGKSMELHKYASEVQVEKINNEVANYIANELGYVTSFQSNYTLAEYKELNTDKTWYILDGYFTLSDGTILFLDFDYDPFSKEAKAINNYVFIADENKRLLLQADEVCNPYKRHFIGALYVILKEKGHIDEVIDFLVNKFKVSPIINAYNSTQFVIQDLTVKRYKPLFVLKENELIKDLTNLDYIQTAMLIPSGRNPSNNEISQTYLPVHGSCQ